MNFFQSTRIQNLKNKIANYENTDGDVWLLYGKDEIQDLLNQLELQDWKALTTHIQSWTSKQKAFLADALINLKKSYQEIDIAFLYGYIFTIVDNSDADYLIQELDFLYDSDSLSIELLNSIEQRIIELREYTQSKHSVHDYENYLTIIKRLLQNLKNE